MNRDDFVEQVTEYCFDDEQYRIDLFLPIKMIGKGKKREIYNSVYGDGEPWSNSDCDVPITHVLGAMIKKEVEGMVEIEFVVAIEKLPLFVEDLWNRLKRYNYTVKVINNGATVDN